MKVLLDTHAFLWWIMDDPRLSQRVKTILSENHNQIFLSSASGWEMAIKVKLGKLSLPKNFEFFVVRELRNNGIEVLPVQMSHALHVHRLPAHHRDPFDRMLIAQSQLENLSLVTNDAQIVRYPIKTIW